MFYFHFVDGSEKPNVSDLHVFFSVRVRRGKAVGMLGTSTHVEHVILYGGDGNFLRSKKKQEKRNRRMYLFAMQRSVFGLIIYYAIYKVNGGFFAFVARHFSYGKMLNV